MSKRTRLNENSHVRKPAARDFMTLELECEQLRVELEDALHQVEAYASRAAELEKECGRLSAMNSRLLNETLAVMDYRDTNVRLRNRLSTADEDISQEKEALSKAYSDLLAAGEALSVSNEKLAVANEERQAINDTLARANAELRSMKVDLARQRMEAKESANHLRAVLDTTDALVMATDESDRIVTFNRACERLTGYAAVEVVGKSAIESLIPPDEQKAVRAVRRRLLRGTSGQRYENHWLTRNGERRRIGWSNSVIRDEKGKVQHVVATGIDVTDLREAERRIRQRQAEVFQLMRVTTVNELGTLIAHELAQPLTAVASYAESCRDMARAGNPADAVLSETIEKVVAQAHRASEMVARLRSLAGRGALIDAPFDLKRTVRDAVALIEAEAGDRNVRLVTTLKDDLPPVRGDRLQIEQVVINLVRNGIEAIAGQGSRRRRVTVETTNSADHVEVAVKDTGSGLPLSFRQELFQPFVTRKRRGLGVGLSICRSIVEQHGGSLSAAPRPSGGTVFRFSLPVARGGKQHAK